MYNGADAAPPGKEKEARLRAFKLACGYAAFQHEVRLHGHKIKRRPRRPQDGTGDRRSSPKR